MIFRRKKVEAHYRSAVLFVLDAARVLDDRGWQPLRTGYIDDHAFHWYWPAPGRPEQDCTMITVTSAHTIHVLPADSGPDIVETYGDIETMKMYLDDIESW